MSDTRTRVTKDLFDGVRIRQSKGARAKSGSLAAWDLYGANDADWFAGYGDMLVQTLSKRQYVGFHYHEKFIDTATCVYGRVLMVLYDMREDSPTKGQICEAELSAEESTLPVLRMPPYVAHAFQGLADVNVLCDLPSDPGIVTDFKMNDADVPYTFEGYL